MNPSDQVLQAVQDYYRVFEQELGRNREQFWAQTNYAVALHPGADRQTGWEAVRQGLQGFPSLGATSLKIELDDMLIQVRGDMAWAIFIERATIGGINESITLDFRITNVYERSNGRWLMVLHHASAKDTQDLDRLQEFFGRLRQARARS